MLSATLKLFCGTSHQHLQRMTALKRTASTVIGHKMMQIHSGMRQHNLSIWSYNLQCKCQNTMGCKKEDNQNIGILFSEMELAYVKQGEEALWKALSILEQQDGWQVEIKEENGDNVSSKWLPGVGKVFRMEAILDAPTKQLYVELFDQLEKMDEWNPSVRQIQVLQRIGKGTVITHEVARETAGNLISQRDFVNIRHCWQQNSTYFLAGSATQTKSMPPQKGLVRAEAGPSCVVLAPMKNDKNKTRLTWLLSVDLKGWLPKSLINQALSQAQVDFIKHLRLHLSIPPRTALL
ncbi:steroidogenic acute regulatory protein-like [Protopterus annectens]|uniref:steroidogenic acute regulatory protein-like n=1 Tax=Protopterus annectens TaxID=7888 RepID=UPI001CFAD005|nr:steroidogenic acute regulatory protein-like [Protopterus annectens]